MSLRICASRPAVVVGVWIRIAARLCAGVWYVGVGYRWVGAHDSARHPARERVTQLQPRMLPRHRAAHLRRPRPARRIIAELFGAAQPRPQQQPSRQCGSRSCGLRVAAAPTLPRRGGAGRRGGGRIAAEVRSAAGRRVVGVDRQQLLVDPHATLAQTSRYD